MSKKFDCDIHQEDKDEIYDCISCVYDRIEQNERERIIANIWERISDLRACTKTSCNCKELARLIEDYIPEWTEPYKSSPEDDTDTTVRTSDTLPNAQEEDQ